MREVVSSPATAHQRQGRGGVEPTACEGEETEETDGRLNRRRNPNRDNRSEGADARCVQRYPRREVASRQDTASPLKSVRFPARSLSPSRS